MIIERIDLKAYGQFTDVALDLSADSHAFHIVYGPNESGKSTSLRAITSLLYGMPHKRVDDYLHPHTAIRVGGRLRGREGPRLECVRRRGRSKTLRDANDRDVIDESRLQEMLGGVDEATFRSQFGLSHEELVQGGAAIVDGDGDLGAILFAAGSGLGRLRELQRELTDRMEAFFKPTGTNPILNQAFKQFDEEKKRLIDLQVPPSEFQRLQAEIAQRQKKLKQLRESQREIASRLARLAAYRKALPLAPQWKTHVSAVAKLQDVPRLDEDFTERRRNLESQGEQLANDVKRLRTKLTQDTEELQCLPSDPTVTTYATEIELLLQRLGACQEARDQRLNWERQLHDLDTIMIDALRELEIEIPVNDPASRISAIEQSVRRLEMTEATRTTIHSLARTFESLIGKQEQARQNVEALQNKLREVHEELHQLGTPADPQILRRTIEMVGAPETRLHTLNKQVEKVENLRQTGEKLLKRLPGFQGTWLQAAKLVLPTQVSVDAAAEQLQRADQAKQLANENLDHLFANRDEILQRMRREQSATKLPTREELQQARNQRDQTLDDLATALSEGRPSIRDINRLRNEVLAADSIIDDICDHAEAVHRRAADQAELHRVEEQINQQQAEVGAVLEQSTEAHEAWQQLWVNIDVQADTPLRMQRWMADHEKLVDSVDAWQSETAQLRRLQKETQDACHRLRKAIAKTSVPSTIIDSAARGIETESSGELFAQESFQDDLVQLYDEATALQSELAGARSRYQQLSQQRDRWKQELVDADVACKSASAQLEQWDQDWQSVTVVFSETTDRRPEVVVSLLSKIDALCNHQRDRNRLTRDIQKNIEDEKDYATRVARLVRLLIPDEGDCEPAELDVAKTVQELFFRLNEEKTNATTRLRLQGQIRETNQELETAQRAKDQSTALLKKLCQEAGCQSVEQLRELERRSNDRRHHEAECEKAASQLRIFAAGEDLETFVATTLQQDGGHLEVEISTLESELQQCEEQLGNLQRELGGLENDLQRIDGSDQASQLRQSLQHRVGEIDRQARQYAQTKVASLILQAAIEDYRRENQGPVLGYAQDFFRVLTCGKYQGLMADHDEKGRPILIGLCTQETVLADRAASGQVGVPATEMSTGTADALYLSLRLASLRHHLTQGPTLPLVVDDCLIQLDDARAAAALQIFSDLSTQTQVILFTHHQHIVDLAQAHLSEGEFHLHRLAAGTAI